VGLYLGAPVISRHVGSVRAVVLIRLASVVCLAAMALAPTFLVAGLVYLVRMLVMAMAGPIAQSFIMGVSDEATRSRLLGVAGIPGQLAMTVSPGIGTSLMQNLSQTAPLWLAVGTFGLSSVFFGLLFHRLVPPEEQKVDPHSPGGGVHAHIGDQRQDGSAEPSSPGG